MYKYIKTLLIENENEFKINLLKEIENINEIPELLEYLNKLINIQYYKGIFLTADEYDEILSENINRIIENSNAFKTDKNMSEIHIKSVESDESEYKYYIESLLESYDIYISDLYYKSEITDAIKLKSIYLNDLYAENNKLEMPSYLDEILIYESKGEYIDYINELISVEIPDMKYDIKNKCYNHWITNYFNYNEYINDLISYDELIEYKNISLESKFIESFYVTDYNKIY